MKITYKGPSGSITTNGIKFTQGATFEVTKEVADKIKATFGAHFDIIEDPEPKATQKSRKRATPKTKIIPETKED